MNEQAFLRGFIKRAQSYGLTKFEAEGIVKQAGLFDGAGPMGAPQGIGNLGKGPGGPKAPTPNLTQGIGNLGKGPGGQSKGLFDQDQGGAGWLNNPQPMSLGMGLESQYKMPFGQGNAGGWSPQPIQPMQMPQQSSGEEIYGRDDGTLNNWTPGEDLMGGGYGVGGEAHPAPAPVVTRPGYEPSRTDANGNIVSGPLAFDLNYNSPTDVPEFSESPSLDSFGVDNTAPSDRAATPQEFADYRARRDAVAPQPPSPPQPAPVSNLTQQGPSFDPNAMFRKYHGGAFDPNSRMDKFKMQQLMQAYNNGGSLLAASNVPFRGGRRV